MRPARRGRALLLALVLASLAAPFAKAAEPSAAQIARVPEALPSAPPLPPAIRKKIALELASRPSDHEPRTRNLRPDGSPEYSNRLLLETSPYLQQHAHNPVNWYPWGDEAFADAKRLGRPVMISIGYSTCHWCHVMEEESFDTVAAASYLNEHFISIKVDREARPDIDAVYMAAVHAMGKSGGWPLNVWLTPDREPFFGGNLFSAALHRRAPGFSRRSPPNQRDLHQTIARGLPNFRSVSPAPSSSSSPASPLRNRASRIGRFSTSRWRRPRERRIGNGVAPGEHRSFRPRCRCASCCATTGSPVRRMR